MVEKTKDTVVKPQGDAHITGGPETTAKPQGDAHITGGSQDTTDDAHITGEPA
ncbi:hypothetical protein ACFY7Z_05480 [Streptomyces sp. NPDC012623]|uniref:hypothetical protein n=1 Tax=unclassified Streptomyces TaxID=2593676 RepID=UPI0036D0F7D2